MNGRDDHDPGDEDDRDSWVVLRVDGYTESVYEPETARERIRVIRRTDLPPTRPAPPGIPYSGRGFRVKSWFDLPCGDAEAISKAMVSAFEACGWKVVRSSNPGEETEEEQGS